MKTLNCLYAPKEGFNSRGSLILREGCDFGGHMNCFTSKTPPHRSKEYSVPTAGHDAQEQKLQNLLNLQLQLQASMIDTRGYIGARLRSCGGSDRFKTLST
ncbi:hypothetical protein BHE74_00021960 [Ensete ventricosum]|nr:hypothetical protein BHE74_00021960 [Ensete ventricosum]